MMSLKAPVFFAGRVVLTRLAIKPISVPPGPGGIVAGVPWLLSPGLFSLCSGEKRRLAQRNQRETQGAKVIQPGSGGELVEIPTPRNRSAGEAAGRRDRPTRQAPVSEKVIHMFWSCFTKSSKSFSSDAANKSSTYASKRAKDPGVNSS